MTDQNIKELGQDEMHNQYRYNVNKPYYDRGFLLGYKKAQAEQLPKNNCTLNRQTCGNCIQRYADMSRLFTT